MTNSIRLKWELPWRPGLSSLQRAKLCHRQFSPLLPPFKCKGKGQDLFEVPPLLLRVSLSLISWVWLLVSLWTSRSSLKTMKKYAIYFYSVEKTPGNPNFAVYYLCEVYVQKPETSLGKKINFFQIRTWIFVILLRLQSHVHLHSGDSDRRKHQKVSAAASCTKSFENLPWQTPQKQSTYIS